MSRQIPTGSRTDWQTPKDFFLALALAQGGFEIDLAANETNHLCPRWYGPGGEFPDALMVKDWPSPGFLNPPYGNMEPWLRKCVEEKEKGNTVVALIPAATGAKWWREWVVPHADILFVTGRIKFGLPKRRKPSRPNHDSAVVVYYPEAKGVVGWINNRPTVNVEGMSAEQAEELFRVPAGDAGDGVHEAPAERSS